MQDVILRPVAKSHRGMVRIPAGTFLMGSAEFYPEERPVHAASVGPFWMDRHLVTVAEFRRFVQATGYLTLAERAPDSADYPQAEAENLVPGGLVFTMPQEPVALDDWRQWWSYVPGADWWHPVGPQGTMYGREMHPVTQVAYQDAMAYAAWAGKSLPTEAEWEFAARGGLESAVFSWGDEFTPRRTRMANTWHGEFPWRYVPDMGRAELPGTTPVCAYPANGYGLYDMTGNVWEWTSDYFTHDHSLRQAAAAASSSATTAVDMMMTGAAMYASVDAGAVDESEPVERYPRRVTKGGSHLCAPNYCLCYRPATRQGQTEDTASCHLGFRCIIRE